MLSLLASILLWVSASNAEIQTSVVACDFNAISSQPGFKAVLYNYDQPQTTAFSDPAFYEGGYLSGTVAGTASSITDINFSVAGGEGKVYNVEVDSSNFAMDYTGYFRGTLICFNSTYTICYITVEPFTNTLSSSFIFYFFIFLFPHSSN